jgi:hypothetical protein
MICSELRQPTDLCRQSVLNALCPATGLSSLADAGRTLRCSPWQLKLWLMAHPDIEALVLCVQATMLRDEARELMNWKASAVELSAGQTITRRTQSDLLWRLADRLEERASRDRLEDLLLPAVQIEGARKDDLKRRESESFLEWYKRVYELYRGLQERIALASAESGCNVKVKGIRPDQIKRAMESVEHAEEWSAAKWGSIDNSLSNEPSN